MDRRTETTEAIKNIGASMVVCGTIVSLFVQNKSILLACYTIGLLGLFIVIFAEGISKSKK